jgi:hypothetical protein
MLLNNFTDNDGAVTALYAELYSALNNSALRVPTAFEVEDFGHQLANSLYRQYVSDAVNAERPTLRMSSLGKPAVHNAIGLPHIQEELFTRLGELEKSLGIKLELNSENPHSERTLLTFHAGDWFEAWASVFLARAGYEPVPIPPGKVSFDNQWRVEYPLANGPAITGHLDLVVRSSKNAEYLPMIVEVKTMSDQYWRSFCSLGYSTTEDIYFVPAGGDDARGYMTQLALYIASTGFPGAWLALNKATFQMALVVPDKDRLYEALRRAEKVALALSHIKCLKDVYTVVKAPPGVPEVHKHSLTGKLLLPPSMKYETVAPPFLFYDIKSAKNGYGKLTSYVGSFDLEEFPDGLSPDEASRHTDYLTYGVRFQR